MTNWSLIYEDPCKLSSDNARVNSQDSTFRPPSEHYENFPVASWLCPPHLRAPIAAIYWFARTADDIADEGTATAEQRLATLAEYREDLERVRSSKPAGPRWPEVFGPLAPMITRFELPTALLGHLLDAFEQDVRYTAATRRYQTDAELHAYCRLSANPVGRLLLHLYGIHDTDALTRSDQICTALQLINFWQDVGRDVAQRRWYPSAERMVQHGVTEADLQRDQPHAGASRMLASYAADARALMLQGAPLAHQIRGRAGWELRLVVQGGLRILDKMATMDCETWRRRPRLGKLDIPLLLWRALTPANGASA
jgi:squalene synthase HpnC